MTTTPTRSTSRRSVRTTASLRDLATASHQKLRRKADEDLSTDRTVTTSPQLLARSPINNANAESPLPDTPSKSIAKGKQKATEAFENAMNQITPTKTKPALNATPAKAQIDYSKPYEVLKVDANPTDKPDTEEIPYETFWGDMLVRYRRKEDMDARRQKMEIWKISMLQKLMATS